MGNPVVERLQAKRAKRSLVGLDCVRIHDADADHPTLTEKDVPGFPKYDRRPGDTLPGVSVVSKCNKAGEARHREDLVAAGLGADELVWVERALGESLYNAVLRSPFTLDVILDVLRNNGALEMFCSSKASERFIAELGPLLAARSCLSGFGQFRLDRSKHVRNPLPKLAAPWNDKVKSREWAVRVGLDHLFPRFRICRSQESLKKEMKRANQLGPYVVKLTPDGASTQDMLFCPAGKMPNPKDYEDRDVSTKGAIVEVFLPHLPVSLTFELRDDGIYFLFASVQKLQGLGGNQFINVEDIIAGNVGSHEGNYVASEGHGIGSFTWERIQQAVAFVRPILQVIWETGYRGTINLDLALLPNGESRLLEFNARVSNSLYAYGVLQRVKSRFAEGCTIYFGNVHGVDPRIDHYAIARHHLQEPGLMYMGGGNPGVQLYHVHKLAHEIDGEPLNACGQIVIGRDFDETTSLAHRMTMVLQGKALEAVRLGA